MPKPKVNMDRSSSAYQGAELNAQADRKLAAKRAAAKKAKSKR